MHLCHSVKFSPISLFLGSLGYWGMKNRATSLMASTGNLCPKKAWVFPLVEVYKRWGNLRSFKQLGSGKVFSGSRIWPKYCAGFEKTRDNLTGFYGYLGSKIRENLDT